MLKRQRPASPPPSMPTIPLVDDPPFETSVRPSHQSKRRRLLPPVLDGQVRGWGKIDGEDGDDEDYEEYEEGSPDATHPDSRLADITGYKSVNGVLSELHELHRRRHFPSSSFNPHLSWLQPILPSCQARDKNGTPTQLQSGFSDDVVPTDELLRVTERYEDTNRLLRSSFLSRRRQLGCSENHATDS